MARNGTQQSGVFDSERRFRLLVEGIVDYAICMLDPNGIVTNWNAGAKRIKGYEAAEVIGRHFGMFYLPKDREAGMPARLDIIEAATEELEHLVDRAVEQHIVVGHVEVAVVVDPGRLDPHHRRDEGGEEHGFKIEPLEHGRTLRCRTGRRPR